MKSTPPWTDEPGSDRIQSDSNIDKKKEKRNNNNNNHNNKTTNNNKNNNKTTKTTKNKMVITWTPATKFILGDGSITCIRQPASQQPAVLCALMHSPVSLGFNHRVCWAWVRHLNLLSTGPQKHAQKIS